MTSSEDEETIQEDGPRRKKRATVLSSATINQYNRFFRGVVSDYMIATNGNNGVKIGGPGMTVEIGMIHEHQCLL